MVHKLDPLYLRVVRSAQTWWNWYCSRVVSYHDAVGAAHSWMRIVHDNSWQGFIDVLAVPAAWDCISWMSPLLIWCISPLQACQSPPSWVFSRVLIFHPLDVSAVYHILLEWVFKHSRSSQCCFDLCSALQLSAPRTSSTMALSPKLRRTRLRTSLVSSLPMTWTSSITRCPIRLLLTPLFSVESTT